MRADDALKYAAALLRDRTDWALDAIGGSDCNRHGHEVELDAIHSAIASVSKLAEQLGDWQHYSDGRIVKSGAQIEDGVYTEHVWHPDPSQEQVHSWRGQLRSDPGIPSPGVYEVTTYPATQEIHVRVVRTA